MRPIKQSAIQNDMRLMEMALYDLTKGQTKNTTPEAIYMKISEYKGIIKRGTYKIDQLEDRVFSRYGIVDERASFDTELCDAMGGDALSGLFGGLFRKSQGIDDKGLNPVNPVNPLNEGNTVDFNAQEEELRDILEEINGKLNKGQIEKDFPDPPASPYEDLGDDDLPF